MPDLAMPIGSGHPTLVLKELEATTSNTACSHNALCHAPSMEKRRLEARVLGLINRVVVEGGAIEDDETECKSEWPADIPKSARHIAGLSNAARGRDVLWLIGLDEKTGTIRPVEQTELSNWWSSVSAEFDSVAPEIQSLWVSTEHGSVMALLFTTDRSPYVVKVKPGTASVHKEVPWRGANGTNSAKREQLLSLLVETTSVPEIELFSPKLKIVGTTFTFTATLDVTAIPPTHRPPLLPRRSWSVCVESDEWEGQSLQLATLSIDRHMLKPNRKVISADGGVRGEGAEFDPESPYGVYVRRVGLIVTGSDSLVVTAGGDAGKFAELCDGPYMSVIVDLPIERTDRVARARCDLQWVNTVDEEGKPREVHWAERK